jgi:hypothetical protein
MYGVANHAMGWFPYCMDMDMDMDMGDGRWEMGDWEMGDGRLGDGRWEMGFEIRTYKMAAPDRLGLEKLCVQARKIEFQVQTDPPT